MQVGGTIAAVGQRLMDDDGEDADQALLRQAGGRSGGGRRPDGSGLGRAQRRQTEEEGGSPSAADPLVGSVKFLSSPREKFSPRLEYQQPNAHDFETATVYYRWHPLFRQTMRIHKPVKDRHGEHIFCELLDGTICSLPTWMFRPDCMHFPIGSPLISVEALAALRDLIAAVLFLGA